MQKKISFFILLCTLTFIVSSFGLNTALVFQQQPLQKQDSIKRTVSENDVDSVKLYSGKFKPFKKSAHASYYADKFHGKRTASGQIFNMNKLTAAHKKLPFGTKVKVTNEANGKSVIVEINDRGPFVKGREIDLSKKAFFTIASSSGAGYIKVTLEVLQK